ncbi:MAG: DUF72 domain-containing protein [Syntrophales bacterium]
MKPEIRIGTSGWNYGHWRGIFYDEDWPKTKWLEFYARRFSTVEVNATFYHLPKPKTVENWRLRTPERFLWSVKASRYITHIKKLRDAREPLERFFNSAVLFGEKLGPVLFQLPPSLKYNEEVFTEFCRLLPRERRHVLEVRNKSWLADDAFSRMEDFNIALCISDTAGRYPYAEAVTADFTYIRLHGSKVLYASDYTEKELQEWARKIRKWKRDAYIYFDNDYAGYAPKNAMRLKEILGVS